MERRGSVPRSYDHPVPSDRPPARPDAAGAPAGAARPAGPASPVGTGLRALFVHAHPDDESILTAGTMAGAVRAGHAVTLLTANRGEAGEVYPAELVHLAGDPLGLAARRESELTAAMGVLGVTDARFLTAPDGIRWVDSGMAGEPSAPVGVDAAGRRSVRFAEVDPQLVTRAVTEVLRTIRPHVVVTYDAAGGYGHPDHVAVHRAVMAAVELAGTGSGDSDTTDPGPGWVVRKVYEVAAPRSRTVAGLVDAATAVRAGLVPGLVAGPDPHLAPAVDDALVTTAVDVSDLAGTKAGAMAAHRTQLTVVRGAARPSLLRRAGRGGGGGPLAGTDPVDLYALTNRAAAPVDLLECFRLVRDRRERPGPVAAGPHLETDLFAGLDDGAPGRTGPPPRASHR